MITTQRVVDALICLFYKGFPVYLIFQSVGKSVTNLRGALSFRVKDLSLLALYIEFCGVFYPKMCISTIVAVSDTTVSVSAKVKSITCCFVHPLKNVILISLIITVPSFLAIFFSFHIFLFCYCGNDNDVVLPLCMHRIVCDTFGHIHSLDVLDLHPCAVTSLWTVAYKCP